MLIVANPHVHFFSDEIKQSLDLGMLKVQVELSVVEENTSSAKMPRKSGEKPAIKNKELSVEVSQPEFTPVAWRRFEIDSNGLHQKESSFESEIEKIGQWSVKNANAMADLVAIRESLLNFHFQGTIKIQRNNVKC